MPTYAFYYLRGARAGHSAIRHHVSDADAVEWGCMASAEEGASLQIWRGLTCIETVTSGATRAPGPSSNPSPISTESLLASEDRRRGDNGWLKDAAGNDRRFMQLFSP